MNMRINAISLKNNNVLFTYHQIEANIAVIKDENRRYAGRPDDVRDIYEKINNFPCKIKFH